MSGVEMFLLLSFLIVADVSAKDPPQKHNGMKHSSLCLHSQEKPPYDSVMWTFNDEAVVYKGMIRPNFTDKVFYDPNNASLCINNLSEDDGGIYEVTIVNTKFKRVVERHRLIVQEAVPKPVLKLFVLSLNDSAAVCNVSVNCSIGDEWSASVCSEDSCRTTSSSFRKVNISISAANGSVVCTGNNQVSSNTESTKAICSKKLPDEPVVTEELSSNTLLVTAVALCVLLCIIVAIVLGTCCSAKFKDHQEQRSLPQQIQSQRGDTLEAAPPLVPRPSSSSEAEVSYENVDVWQQSQTSSEYVSSIYCLLQAPKATAAAAAAAVSSSEDAPGHDSRTQDAASSQQTVALDETEQSNCVSEYSVVQRPKTVKSQHPQQAEQDSQRLEPDK